MSQEICKTHGTLFYTSEGCAKCENVRLKKALKSLCEEVMFGDAHAALSAALHDYRCFGFDLKENK